MQAANGTLRGVGGVGGVRSKAEPRKFGVITSSGIQPDAHCWPLAAAGPVYVRVIMWRLVVLCWGVLLGTVAAQSPGEAVCARNPPDTAQEKTPGDNGFRIKLAGRPQPERYTAGQVYTGK